MSFIEELPEHQCKISKEDMQWCINFYREKIGWLVRAVDHCNKRVQEGDSNLSEVIRNHEEKLVAFREQLKRLWDAYHTLHPRDDGRRSTCRGGKDKKKK